MANDKKDEKEGGLPPTTEFDHFVSQWPNQRPPKQEIRRLARKLCGTRKLTVVRHVGAALSPKQRLEDYDNNDSSSSRPGSVSWNGINPRWFTTVFCQLPEVQTLMAYGCRMWFLREYAILEIIRKYQAKKKKKKKERETDNYKQGKEKDIHSRLDATGPAIQFLHLFRPSKHDNDDDDSKTLFDVERPATAFISFTGSYTIAHFVKLMHHADLQGRFVWIDTFCVDQFAWTREASRTSDFRCNFPNQLQIKIREIGYTALLLNKWSNVHSTLRQIWVLWEIFATAQCKAQLRFLFTGEEQDDFVNQGLLKERFKLSDALGKITAENTVALYQTDKEYILQSMSANGGIGQVNKIVSKALRDWVSATTATHLQPLKVAAQQHKSVQSNSSEVVRIDVWTPKDQAHLFRSHAKYLGYMGDYEGAEEHFWRAMELYGRSSKEHYPCLIDLGRLLQSQGKDGRAKKLVEDELNLKRQETYEEYKTIQGCCCCEKEVDPGCCNCVLCLWNVWCFFSSAILVLISFTVLMVLLSILTGILWSTHAHQHTVLVTFLLLFLCCPCLTILTTWCVYSCSNYREKIVVHNMAERYEWSPGNHINVREVDWNETLGSTLEMRGEYKNCESLYKAAWDKSKLDGDDERTFRYKKLYARALYRHEKYIDAKDLMEDLVLQETIKSGETHPTTIDHMDCLGGCLFEIGKHDEALVLMRTVVEKKAEIHGETHPDTLVCMHRLAEILQAQGKHLEASALLKRMKRLDDSLTKRMDRLKANIYARFGMAGYGKRQAYHTFTEV